MPYAYAFDGVNWRFDDLKTLLARGLTGVALKDESASTVRILPA